jgi:hypothetical protein
MKNPQLAPDWGRIIEDMVAAGHSQADIGKAMNVDLTDRMLSHYRAGVQPTYWRGAALLALWCKVTKRKMETVYMVEVVRGHRVPNNRAESSGPRVQSLPQWPAAAKPAVKRAKKVKEPA